MAGFDTASYVYDVRVAAVNAFGTPNFWLRYFSPCQTTAFNANWTNATSESRAIWDSGGPKLGAIRVPTQSRLRGTTAMGQADAQTLGNSLHNAWLSIGPLQLPTNGQLWCWLDQEPGTGLSLAYWNGWSGTIDGYNWGGSGQLPLYPCMYTDPCNAQPNCSIVGRSDANWCYSIWSYHPSRCSYNNPEPATVGGEHVQRLRAELPAHADEPLAVRLSELRLLPQRRPGPRRRHHLRELLLLPILAAVGRS